MTGENDTDDTDSTERRSLRVLVQGLSSAVQIPSPLHLLRFGVKGLNAAFELIQYALEADEEATVAALEDHDDPVDTVAALAKIVRDGGGDG